MSIAEKVLQLKQDFDDVYAAGGGSGDYDQGYEDGKNSVLPIERYTKQIQLTSLNIFGKREVVLNLDNATTLQNLFNISANDNVNRNITVEHLTINMQKTIAFMQTFYCHSTVNDATLKHLTLNIDTSSCTSFANAFTNLRALEIIDGTPFNFTSATNVGAMFNYCNSLVEVRFAPNTLVKSISLSNSSNLSTDTIQSIIDGLADLTGGTAQTLTLHADVGTKLTDEQKAIITAKNWTLVY